MVEVCEGASPAMRDQRWREEEGRGYLFSNTIKRWSGMSETFSQARLMSRFAEAQCSSPNPASRCRRGLQHTLLLWR